MADQKLSQLTAATLPLAGTELVYTVQGGAERRTTAAAIAALAAATNLSYDPATRLLSSSTGADVTLPLVSTTAAGLVPSGWLTGAEAATLPHIHGALAGVVYEHVRNVSGATMAAMTPYHVVGSQGDTDRVQIVPADSSDPQTMPASGILMTALANNEDGHGVIAGVPTGLNTVANPSGTTLYVGTGVLTATAPAANVQAIAVVGRSHASTGTLSMLQGPSLALVAYTGAYGDLIGRPTLGTAAAAATTDFAPAAQGVSNGNNHDHSGGDGAQIAYGSLAGLPTLFDPAVPGAIGGTTPSTGQFTGVGLGGVAPRTGYAAVLGSNVLPRAQIVTVVGSTYTCDIRAANRFMLAAAIAENTTIAFSNVGDLAVAGGFAEYVEVEVDFRYTSGVVTISAAGFTTTWDGNTAATPTAGEIETLIVRITPAVASTPFSTATVYVAPMRGRA
jgi:hypothetical protein